MALTRSPNYSTPQLGASRRRLEWVIPFFTGVNNNDDPASINDTDLVDTLNTVYDSAKSVGSRKGYTKLLTTSVSANPILGIKAAYKSDGTTKQLLYANGTGVYKYDNAGGSTLISGFTFNAAATQYDFDIWSDTVYIANGLDNPQKYDFSTISPVGNVDTGGFATGLTPMLNRVHKNRLWLVNPNSSTVYFSNAGDTNTFPVNNFIQINTNDAQTVTGMKSLLDSLNVFKTDSIWVITGEPLGAGNTTTIGNLQLRQANSDVGCIASRTIANVGSVIFFMARSGVYVLQNYQSQLISTQINDTFLTGMNPNQMSKSWAVYSPIQKKYILCYPSTTSSTPDKAAVYDLVTKQWTLWDDLPFSCGATFRFNQIEDVVAGDARKGNVYTLFQGNADIAGDSGTSTGGNISTTLKDTTKTWTVNGFADCRVRITGGTGAGQNTSVVSNTSNTLTVSPAWTTTPDSTSVYGIGYYDSYMTTKIMDFGQTEMTKKHKYLNIFTDSEGNYNLQVGNALDFAPIVYNDTASLLNGGYTWGTSGPWGSIGPWGQNNSIFRQVNLGDQSRYIQTKIGTLGPNQPWRVTRISYSYKLKKARPT